MKNHSVWLATTLSSRVDEGAALADLALGASEGLHFTELGEGERELRAPVVDVGCILLHIGLRAGVPVQARVNAQQALLGHQVHVVVVVEQHGRLLVVTEVCEVHGVRCAGLHGAPVLQQLRKAGVHLRVNGGVDPLSEALTMCPSDGVRTYNTCINGLMGNYCTHLLL